MSNREEIEQWIEKFVRVGHYVESYHAQNLALAFKVAIELLVKQMKEEYRMGGSADDDIEIAMYDIRVALEGKT